MSNLQNINFKELFNPFRLNEFNKSLQAVSGSLSNAEKNAQSLFLTLSNSFSGLNTVVNLFNVNVRNAGSSLIFFNSGVALLNTNLQNTGKVLQLITESTAKSASVMQASVQTSAMPQKLERSNTSGGVSGYSGEGPKDKISLEEMKSAYESVTKIVSALELKAGISTWNTLMPIPPITEGLSYSNDALANYRIQNELNTNLDPKLEKMGLVRPKVSDIDGTGVLLEPFKNILKEKGWNKAANFIDKMGSGYSVAGTVSNWFDLQAMRQFKNVVGEKVSEEEQIQKPKQQQQQQQQQQEEKQGKAVYKSARQSNFERDLSAGGQKENGAENNTYLNLASGTSSRAGKSKKGSSKKEEDPVDTFVGVFTEAQKIGGALTTIMQTLNIGSHTFVGGIINGFNSALSIIQTMITVMQAVNTIKMFLPFATGGNVPGIGDTDSVPAMLTPGEYVVKKSVVNKYGSGFFEWINGGGLTKSNIQNREEYFALAA